MSNKERRPGDLFLDRYLPDADEETRELARERLREYVLHLISVGERIQQRRESAKALEAAEGSIRRPEDETDEKFDSRTV